MKKTALLAVALATCLGYAPARAADVVSSNIVGYQKMQLTSQFTLVAAQFNNIGAETKDVQDFIGADNDLPGLDADNGYAVQTELRYWNGTGYDTYGWDPDGDPNIPNSDHKWVDEDLAVASFDMDVGTAVWIKVPTGTTGNIVLSGEVPEGDSKEIQLRAGFNLIANPFPTAIDIQKIQAGATIPGLDAENGYAVQTELRYWDGTGYETYGWDSEGDPNVPNSDHKWVDEDLVVATRTIELGKGFWIKTPVAGTVTISK